MAKSTRGFCKYCGKEYTRTGIAKHLQTCKKRVDLCEKAQKKSPCGEHGHEKWHKDSSRIKFDVFPALFCCPKGRIPLAGRCPLW